MLEKMLSLTSEEKLAIISANGSPYVYHFISTLAEAPLHNLDRQPTKHDKDAIWNIKSMYLGGITVIDVLPMIRRKDEQYVYEAKEASKDAGALLAATTSEEFTLILEKFLVIVDQNQHNYLTINYR